MLPQMAINVAIGEVRVYPVDLQNGTDGLRAVYGGSATALTPSGDGRFAGGTGHFGSLFAFDPATGEIDFWGRPLPELGQKSGEEVAPIQGLARGPDWYLYTAIGTGVRGTEKSHLVRLDTTGQVTSWTHVPESIHGLVSGADGRVYGAALVRVVSLATLQYWSAIHVPEHDDRGHSFTPNERFLWNDEEWESSLFGPDCNDSILQICKN